MLSILLSNTQIANAINKSVNRIMRIIDKFFLNITHKQSNFNRQTILHNHMPGKQIFEVTNGDRDDDKC
jgi:hypothetical protein